MITTDAASAVQNLVSIGLMMALRKSRAGLFLKKKQKRYEKWRASHLEPEEHPKHDKQTLPNSAKIGYAWLL